MLACSVNNLYIALPFRPSFEGWWTARKATSSRSSESENGVRLCANGEVGDESRLLHCDLTHAIEGVPLGIAISVSGLETGGTACSQDFDEEGMEERRPGGMW